MGWVEKAKIKGKRGREREEDKEREGKIERERERKIKREREREEEKEDTKRVSNGEETNIIDLLVILVRKSIREKRGTDRET